MATARNVVSDKILISEFSMQKRWQKVLNQCRILFVDISKVGKPGAGGLSCGFSNRLAVTFASDCRLKLYKTV